VSVLSFVNLLADLRFCGCLMPAFFGALTVGRQVSLRMNRFRSANITGQRNSVKNDSQISLKNLSTLVLLPQSRRLPEGRSDLLSLIPGHFHTRMRLPDELGFFHWLMGTRYLRPITHRSEQSPFERRERRIWLLRVLLLRLGRWVSQ